MTELEPANESIDDAERKTRTSPRELRSVTDHGRSQGRHCCHGLKPVRPRISLTMERPKSDRLAFGEIGGIVEIAEIAYSSVESSRFDFNTLRMELGLLFLGSTLAAGRPRNSRCHKEKEKCRASYY